jgi:hypothetical protein
MRKHPTKGFLPFLNFLFFLYFLAFPTLII